MWVKTILGLSEGLNLKSLKMSRVAGVPGVSGVSRAISSAARSRFWAPALVLGLTQSLLATTSSTGFTADDSNGFTTYGPSATLPYTPGTTYNFSVSAVSGSGAAAAPLYSTATIPLAAFPGTGTSFTVSWRTRNQDELPGQSTSPPFELDESPPAVGLASDVLNLGVTVPPATTPSTPEQTAPYVLEMTYSPTEIVKMYDVPGTVTQNWDIETIWKAGWIQVGYVDTSDNDWDPAIEGNYLTGSAVVADEGLTRYQGTSGGNIAGSFESFANQYAVDASNLSDFVGAEGVDEPSSGQYEVWAVLDHASTFAVIPEPTSGLLLLGATYACGSLARRRRSRAVV
jgi:hypothetical protein